MSLDDGISPDAPRDALLIAPLPASAEVTSLRQRLDELEGWIARARASLVAAEQEFSADIEPLDLDSLPPLADGEARRGWRSKQVAGAQARLRSACEDVRKRLDGFESSRLGRTEEMVARMNALELLQKFHAPEDAEHLVQTFEARFPTYAPLGLRETGEAIVAWRKGPGRPSKSREDQPTKWAVLARWLQGTGGTLVAPGTLQKEWQDWQRPRDGKRPITSVAG